MFANETNETKGDRITSIETITTFVRTKKCNELAKHNTWFVPTRFSIQYRIGLTRQSTDDIIIEVCYYYLFYVLFHFSLVKSNRISYASFFSFYSSVQPQVGGEQRQAHFRSDSNSHTKSASMQPQTGLGILMNGSASTTDETPATIVSNQTYATQNLTPEQQARLHEDLKDREQQASALAAAGLVADSVSYTRTGGQILQAPPSLMGMPAMSLHAAAVPLSSVSARNINTDSISAASSQHHSNNHNSINNGPPIVENINWNLDVGGGPGAMMGTGLDDIDMDFATLFDSEEQILIDGGGLDIGAATAPQPAHD
jgi:hypothetical protein